VCRFTGYAPFTRGKRARVPHPHPCPCNSGASGKPVVTVNTRPANHRDLGAPPLEEADGSAAKQAKQCGVTGSDPDVLIRTVGQLESVSDLHAARQGGGILKLSSRH
jgi:hypothetical protein